MCSWSLRPGGPEELARGVRAVGLSAVQLALDPLRSGAWPVDGTVAALADAGVEIRSGMMAMAGEDYSSLESIRRTGGVRPDRHWSTNLRAAAESAQLARRIGIPLVSFHAGFIPEERDDPLRRTMLERLRAIVDRFADQGVGVAFETGQESAATLLAALDDLDRPAAGINFDPANMILYGMGDPISALGALAPRVVQIHIKDATATDEPGTWGREVAAGEGEVDWRAFFRVVEEESIDGDLMIEREAGGDRAGEMRRAREMIEGMLTG
ncbi:MAG: sugar phosphate isomerase/epimerase family protein [Planctomycetota bacterium]